MTLIKKIRATVTHVEELSPTAREITFVLSGPLHFIAGNFVNLFVTHRGTVVRRAYSLSSSDANPLLVSVLMRLLPQGEMSSLFFERTMIGTDVVLMGPLGMNTADTLRKKKVFLFGFGIGVGVIASVADHLLRRVKPPSLTIVTGSRSREEILCAETFSVLAKRGVRVRQVISRHAPAEPLPVGVRLGYIQDHTGDFDFTDADVYICGQTVACADLQTHIIKTAPRNCRFTIEAFH